MGKETMQSVAGKRWGAGILAVVVLVAVAGPARSAEPTTGVVGMEDAPPPDRFKVSAAWRSRLEMWDFFEPSGAGGANNNYDFVGSDLRVQAAWNDPVFDVLIEGQAVGLVGLPSEAVGTPAEGPYGTGAIYRLNNGEENESSVYLRQAVLRLKKLGVDGLTLRGGRQSFSDGKEAVPSDPTLAWLQNTRIAERLVGPFDFTYPGRSFDSALLQYGSGALTLSGFYGKPTQGGFSVNGMDQIDNIDLAYASANLNHPGFAGDTAMRLFYLFYADDRALLKVDNRPLAARQADSGDIAVHTLGADVLQLVPTPAGPIDLLGWFAWQGGDWGNLDHNAWSLAVEAGMQPSALPWKPWLRAGYNIGSGDGDPADGDHETFFQLLPTPRLYSLSTMYNLMNSQDFFLQLVLRPIAGLVWRTDFHALWLADDADNWYFGGGATRERGPGGFGYGARPSGGGNSLMQVLETQVSYNWNDWVSTTAYYGHGFGGDVVDADFRGNHADYGFLELTLKLPPM